MKSLHSKNQQTFLLIDVRQSGGQSGLEIYVQRIETLFLIVFRTLEWIDKKDPKKSEKNSRFKLQTANQSSVDFSLFLSFSISMTTMPGQAQLRWECDPTRRCNERRQIFQPPTSPR
jgi:hypothetical protein